MPDLARCRREAALISPQVYPAGEYIPATPPACALFAPAGRFRLSSSRLGTTYTTVSKYVWTGESYSDPLLYAYVGSAWRHYSARHAALRSGSNEPRMYDGLGSTRQLINHTDQSVTDTYEYEAFGNLMSSSGSTPNPYEYVGSLGYYQIYPPAGGPGLMHLGARYYMPEVGRFVSQDPMLADDDPHAIAYPPANNNPVGQVDPTGLAICLIGSVSLKGCKFLRGTGTDKKKCPKDLSQLLAYIDKFNLNTCVGTPKNCKPHNQRVELGLAIHKATCYYSCKFTGKICENCPNESEGQDDK